MRLGVYWRFAKDLRERFTETAVRFKTAAVSRLIHATALPHLDQRNAHPARAVIRLKRHSIMTLELSPRGGWIDRERCQFLVRQPAAGSGLHFRGLTLAHVRLMPGWIERVAGTAST